MKKIIHKLILSITLLFGVVNIGNATDGGAGMAPQKYAVIINGVGSAGKNYIRYWYDCSIVYQTLLGKGYDPNNIYVLMADGTVNNYNGTSSVCNSPSLDLDGDGNNDIQYPATLDNIEYIFGELSGQMTGDDDLFIYTVGEGGQIVYNRRNFQPEPNTPIPDSLIIPFNPVHTSYLVLWGGEDHLIDWDFANMLAPIPARTKNIVMQQDFSGGFIDSLIRLDNIVITTACDITGETHAMARNVFDEFTYRWVSAITGSSPYSMIPCNVCSIIDPYHYSDLTDCFIANDGDYNADGYVTMQEAFNYVGHYSQAMEQPLIISNPSCLSYALALDEVLYANDCSAALIEGWDLYMKDSPEDPGDEPNITTQESWITSDIWFEENGVKVNVLTSNQTYDICVRVRNRGADPSPGGEILYAHWTKARIGGSWPWGWTGYTYDCNGTPVRQGDYVGYISLPSIGGGETYVARIPWTTPETDEFSPCFEFSGAYLNELWHYCVLARIVDSQEQPDETITDMDFRDFVLDFNNVVSCNVTIMGTQNNYLNETVSTGVVGFANPLYADDSGPYTLRCAISGMENWEQVANVTLTVPSSFLAEQTSMTSYNCHDYGDGNYDIFNDSYFENIYFASYDDNFYPLIVQLNYYNYNQEQYYNFKISLVLEDASGMPVGGERFIFQNYPQSMVNRIRAREMPAEEDGTIIKQKSAMPEDILYVDIYNAQGQLLVRTTNENMESLHLPQGVYILRKVGETQSYSVKIIK